MRNLDQMRKIFPSWASEMDVAKEPCNWSMWAQEFFCAANVLYQESTTAHQAMHKNTFISLDNLMRHHIYIPAVFCLAFSLELAVKAALVKCGALKDINEGQGVKFVSHDIWDLANKIDNLCFDEKEQKILKWASNFIKDGKYPVPTRPSNNKSGLRLNRQIEDMINEIIPLYEKLLAYVSNE